MSIVSVQIRHKYLPVLPWNIVGGFSEACTLLELFTAIKNGTLGPKDFSFPDKMKGYSVSAAIGRNKMESFDQVMMSMNVMQTAALFGHYIRFDLSEGNENGPQLAQKHVQNDDQARDPHSNGKRDAFQVLIDNAKKTSLPKQHDLDKKVNNNKHIVFNQILAVLKKAQLGFTAECMENGKNFIQALTNCLWYIDPHLEKIRDRSLDIPVLFDHLTGYNNPQNHKHKRHDIDRTVLLAHAVDLDRFIEQPWLNGPMWLVIKTAVINLSETLHKYHDYLEASAKRVQDNRECLQPVRSHDETKSLDIIYPRYVVKPGVASRYKPLNDHLQKLEPFKPICVDEYTPPDTRKRRYYIDNLKMGIPYKCMHLKIDAGNNLGAHNFIWRVRTDVTEGNCLMKIVMLSSPS